MVDRMSADRMRDMRGLAARVTEELNSFGFLLAVEESGGFVVELDAGDDGAGGVYVSWKNPSSVSSKVGEMIRNKELESPFLAQAARFSSEIQQVLASSLSLRGFLVELEDDMRPFGVRVISGQ